jgi:hypothetical protein
MDVRFIKVIKDFGEFALIKIDGREFKAKVEGKIPSAEFWGTLSNKDGKVIIKVVDSAVITNRNEVLIELGLKRTKGNFFLLDVLRSLSLPIKTDFFKLHEVYNIPPLILGLLAKSKKENIPREKLLLIREVLIESKRGKFSSDELEVFLNSLLFPNLNNEKLLIIDQEDKDKEKWFGYVEFDEDKFKKIILSTEIEKVSVYIIFEKLPNFYKLDIYLYGDVNVNSPSVDELKSKLEEMNISPIFVNMIITGGENEESSSTEV